MNSRRKPTFLSLTLLKVGWRYFFRSPWQSALMIVGIMLGVAVVVGVDIANLSAATAFDLSTDTIAGRASHLVSGGPAGLDEDIYTELRRAGLPYPSAPAIQEYVYSEQLGEIPLQLLGIDPFAEAPFRSYLANEGGVPLDQLTRFLTEPGAVLLSVGLAERYNLGLNDSFEIEISGQLHPVTVAGLLEPADDLSRRALDSLILADIATAQQLTGRLGRIDKIDLILPPDDPAALEQVQANLPENAQLLPAAARSGTVEQMTAAFSTNLTALSLLALVVGVFLIYNTITFSVVQRRPMFGVLRCLGVTSREVFLLVIIEALSVGTIGGILGILLGILLGQGSVSLVSQTINDLFFTSTVQDVGLPVASLVKGTLLGITATVLAAAAPAWEAASVPPRTALSRAGLESKAGRLTNQAALAGVVMILLGVGTLLLIPTRSLVISFLGTFAVVIGAALLTPAATRGMMRGVTPLTSRLWGALGRMAPRQVINAISRTSIAVAALMVAVSVTIGVSLMVGSFRATVITWMDQILSGDIYVSVPSASLNQITTTIDPLVLEALADWPGIARMDMLRTATVDSPYGPVEVGANNNPFDGEEQIYLATDGSPQEIWAQVQQGAVLVSEPLANRLDLPHHGGSLTLYTDRGPVEFPVVGIYYDYSSTQGAAILWLDQYRQYWDDPAISALSLKLESGQDIDQMTAEMQTALTPIQRLDIRANQALKAETLAVFDRTFAITGALQLLATLVAFVGVLAAMLSLQLEKQRQFGILRAVGLTIEQLWGLILLETGLMGAVAGLLAMPTGYALSLILVYIINRRSFGWTLQMQLTPRPFVEALVVALLAALLAGLYPARRLSRRRAADAMRFD